MVNDLPANAEDVGLILDLGRSPHAMGIKPVCHSC